MDLYHNYFIKELLWYLVGFTLIFIISKININLLFKYSFYFYMLGNALLLITLFWGTNVNGSTSWLYMGPVGMQPSEFVKISLITYLAYFTKKYKLSDFKYIISGFIIVLIPSVLTFLEPDTGAVIIYFIIFLGFLINKKLNKWWYIGSIAIITLMFTVFFVLYYGYQEIFINVFGTSFFYRMDRITQFFNREGYQISTALISIGSSGLFGRGLTNSFKYFPEAPTDFAFALLIKNIGYVGIIIFLIIYCLLFYYLIKSINKKNKLYILPIIIILLFQFSVNIFMNIGIFPIIGITLPFISYGGSNLLSYLILIGIVVNNKRIKI